MIYQFEAVTPAETLRITLVAPAKREGLFKVKLRFARVAEARAWLQRKRDALKGVS